MKRLFASLLLCLMVLSASAQKHIFLFPEFQDGTISFKGYPQQEKVVMNIDAMTQTVYYYQGETLMELTNVPMIDTLSLGGKTFVIKDGLLCERLAWPEDTLYVNWKFKKVNVGSKGALGATTQNKVDVLWTSLTPGEAQEGEGLFARRGDYIRDVWESKGDNTYFFSIDGREYKARRLKDLYKAFPDQSADLKAFVKERQYTLEKAQQAFQVIAFLKTLVNP